MMEIIHLDFPLSNGGVEPLCAWKITGRESGPVFVAIAEQHGNELNGCAAIRNFVRKYENELKRGTFIGIPFANPFALRLRMPSSDLGGGRPYIESARNMQTLWNETDGNEIARLAAFWWNHILKDADCLVDLHCYPEFYAPMVAVRPDPKWEKLGYAAAMPLIRCIKREDDWKGSLRYKAESAGKISIGVELSGQYDLSDREIDRGMRVLENLAAEFGLLDEMPHPPTEKPVEIRNRIDISAPAAGLFIHHPGLTVGKRVKKGDSLGFILRSETLEEVPVTAPESGIISVLGGRADCDVTLSARHRYVFLDERIIAIIPC